MKRLVGCAGLAVLLCSTPLAAEDAMEALAAPSPAPAAAIATTPVEPPAPPPKPVVTLVLKADLGAQRLTVVDRGKVVHTWPISSGRRGYATRTGTFRPQWTARMWYSRQYERSPMPHAVFFNRGTAFHATGAVGLLGRPASHGCIRLAPAHAAQLYKLVHKHALTATQVVVHGAPKFHEPAVARRAPRRDPAYAQARQGYGSPPFSIWPF